MARKTSYTDIINDVESKDGHAFQEVPGAEQLKLQQRLSRAYDELEKARAEKGHGIVAIMQCNADQDQVDEAHKKLERLMKTYMRKYGADALPKVFRDLPEIQAIIEQHANVKQRTGSPVLGGKPVLGF